MQRTSLPPICASAPKTCSTRARGVAMRRLRFFLRIGDARGGASFALDVHAPAFLFQLRLPFGCGVAAIGIDIAAGVGAVQQRSNTVVSATAACVTAILRISL